MTVFLIIVLGGAWCNLLHSASLSFVYPELTQVNLYQLSPASPLYQQPMLIVIFDESVLYCVSP